MQLKIYDLSGRVVKTFNPSTNQPFNQVIWNATGDKGNKVLPGVYFCKLGTEKEYKVAKLILLK
ncbi:MAG: T9SS type A sorting domain-containing protein [Candidatus Stahlbacteria bacterium]|nr:T9SS type A sorting domain-containing protein [Candidatus Stahlbacteria bacterium]